jgi:hypothetical protein
MRSSAPPKWKSTGQAAVPELIVTGKPHREWVVEG